jgi:hypothetical protein
MSLSPGMSTTQMTHAIMSSPTPDPAPRPSQFEFAWRSSTSLMKALRASYTEPFRGRSCDPTWERFWSRIYKDTAWHRATIAHQLRPGLVGSDLYLVAVGDRQVDKLLALVFPGHVQSLDKILPREKLLESLRPHVEIKKDEIFFPEWKLTLNISSLYSGERAVVSRPHLLFSLDGSLSESLKTTLLCYEENATLRDVPGGHIGGMCNRLETPKTLGDVKDVCSVLLFGTDGEARYHRFQRPGCPRVRAHLAEYRGQAIGPWRFERY